MTHFQPLHAKLKVVGEVNKQLTCTELNVHRSHANSIITTKLADQTIDCLPVLDHFIFFNNSTRKRLNWDFLNKLKFSTGQRSSHQAQRIQELPQSRRSISEH